MPGKRRGSAHRRRAALAPKRLRPSPDRSGVTARPGLPRPGIYTHREVDCQDKRGSDGQDLRSEQNHRRRGDEDAKVRSPTGFDLAGRRIAAFEVWASVESIFSSKDEPG